MAIELTPEQAEQLIRIGSEAAGAAIAKGQVEVAPDREKIHNLATLAASAAIKKHLGEEEGVNKEKAADIALAVAQSAISKGLGETETKDEKQFRRVESIAKEAAVAAMNMGVGKE